MGVTGPTHLRNARMACLALYRMLISKGNNLKEKKTIYVRNIISQLYKKDNKNYLLVGKTVDAVNYI